MRSIRFSHLALALVGLAAVPAFAGDYSFISPGFQIGAGQALSNNKYGLRDADLKPLGLGDPTLYNAAVVFQWRLGEVTGPMRDFSLVTSIGVDTGSAKESSTLPNIDVVVAGVPQTMVGVTANRKTTQQDFYLSVPLRWYPGLKGNQSEGLWIEVGPGWVRQSQKTDLSLSGQILSNPVVLNDSIRYTQTKFAWNFGLGWARQYDHSTMGFGVQYRVVKDSGTLPNNVARLVLQWAF